VRLYFEVAVRSFRRATTYRIAFLAGIITNAFFGAMLSYVFLAVYGSRASVAGFTPNDTLSYLWCGQALISIGSAWLVMDLGNAIKSGDVAVDLMRLWNFYAYWVSQQIGSRGFNLLTRGALTYLIGFLYFGARIPEAQDVVPFLVSIALAIVVSCAISFLTNATAFWLLDISGVMTIASITMMFFSGFLVPLAFFPPWLAQIAALLPFQAVTSVPLLVFLGKLRGDALWQNLGLQVFWACVLTGAALWQMRAATSKIVIQGG
jgi:ABC-2 type transport system permease protein